MAKPDAPSPQNKQQPKLFQQLRLLQSKELKSFNQFLRSPYFNTNPTLVTLFQLLQPHYPNFHTSQLQELKQQLFPDASPTKINQAFSDLGKLVYRFLEVHALFSNPLLQHQATTLVLWQRDSYPALEKYIQKQAPQPPATHPEHYLDTFLCLEKGYFHPNRIDHQETADLLPSLTQHLDAFFIAKKLKFLCDQAAITFTFEDAFPITPLDQAILQAAPQYAAAEHPYIFLLHHLWQALHLTPNVSPFYQALAIFKTHNESLPKVERAFLLTKLILLGNHHQRRHQPALDSLLDLYRYGDQEQLLVSHNKITSATLLNLTSVGAHAQHFEWTASCIQKYAPLLPPEHATEVPQLARAILAFHQGNFRAAIDQLQGITKKSTHLRIRIHTLYLRCLLLLHLEENNQLDTLKDTVKNFKAVIKRNKKLSADNKTALLNFAQVVLQLAKTATEGWPPHRLHSLKADIEHTDRLVCRPWLRRLLP
ncbi:MAG: hypothetical protein AAF798_14500 [Bacteroidota bacterium]